MTRNLKFMGCLWVTAASLALAQEAPPAPPAPRAAAATPVALPADPPDMPFAAPTPAAAPKPFKEVKEDKEAKEPKAATAPKGWVIDDGQAMNLEDWGQYIDLSNLNVKVDGKALAEQIKAANQANARAFSIDAGTLGQEIRDAVKSGQWDQAGRLGEEIAAEVQARTKAYQDEARMYQDLGRLYAQATPPMPPQPPTPPLFGQQGRGVGGGISVGPRGQVFRVGPNTSEDRIFNSGEANLDNHNLDNALVNFNEVISRGGSRADGATYYKAFTLAKMGRKDEAQSAINELRKSYASSHWQADAAALEADLKSGKSSSEEDDIKVMAIDGLMQSDPERAFPILEGLIKGAHIPRLKKEAVMVLAKNSSPRAQTLLEQIARGTAGDPDQQLAALRYVVDIKSNPARAQLLMDVYNSAGNDVAVRSLVIQVFRNNSDYDHLGQILKVEKNAELRDSVMNKLGDEDGQPQLWAIYGAETTPEGKINILRFMHENGNTDKLAEIARADKDPRVRRAAVRELASFKGANVSASLVAIYGNESDNTVKKEIAGDLADHKDAKPLIEIFRKEKDVEMRRYLMTRMVNIHSPEMNDFFLEILK